MAKFGERLRLLRTSRDLSQMELSKQLKISKSSINMYERCEREPNLEMLEKIADYFNVDLDYLLGKSDCPNKYSFQIGQLNSNIGSANIGRNVLRLAGRDGSYREQVLTDQQLSDLLDILDQMPDASEYL